MMTARAGSIPLQGYPHDDASNFWIAKNPCGTRALDIGDVGDVVRTGALGGGKPPTSNLAKRLLEWLATRENEVNRLTHMMVAPVEDEDTLAA
jgi:hypothetical protein